MKDSVIVTVGIAEQICILAHRGQTRNDGVTPYCTHPIAVAEMMTTDEEKIVALLHDVPEDTKWYLDQSVSTSKRYICSPEGKCYELTYDIHEALGLLDKTGYNHKEYIDRVGHRLLAIKPKIADMFHNISSNPKDTAKEKYYANIKFLLAKLTTNEW